MSRGSFGPLDRERYTEFLFRGHCWVVGPPYHGLETLSVDTVDEL